MNHKDVSSADELIQWLRDNTMAGVDSISYVNKYLVETVDQLLERNVAPPRVFIKVSATFEEDRRIMLGYLVVLNIWEGETNFSAQQIYFPAMNGKIVSVLVTHRPGT